MDIPAKILKELTNFAVQISTPHKMNEYKTGTICREAYAAPAYELIDMTIEGMLCESNENLFETEGLW